jgi:hypothetical protein
MPSFRAIVTIAVVSLIVIAIVFRSPLRKPVTGQ